MKIVVTGGSGYVGQTVVKKLTEAGHDVRCLVHSARRIEMDNVEKVACDISDKESLAGTMTGSDVLVHLVGIIKENKRKGITMHRIHVEGTRNVMEEAHKAGIKRVLHMSALGAREGAVSGYHQSKWEAEQIVKASGIPYTIFRPSVIFGAGGPGPNFVNQLKDLVKSTPVVPVIGDGKFLLQPVSVNNVAEGFVHSLQAPVSVNAVYEVGGPEQLTYVQLLVKIAEAMNKKLKTVSVPVKLMKLIVPLMQTLPGFPITSDQLQMLLEGNACKEHTPFFKDLNITPDHFSV